MEMPEYLRHEMLKSSNIIDRIRNPDKYDIQTGHVKKFAKPRIHLQNVTSFTADPDSTTFNFPTENRTQQMPLCNDSNVLAMDEENSEMTPMFGNQSADKNFETP